MDINRRFRHALGLRSKRLNFNQDHFLTVLLASLRLPQAHKIYFATLLRSPISLFSTRWWWPDYVRRIEISCITVASNLCNFSLSRSWKHLRQWLNYLAAEAKETTNDNDPLGAFTSTRRVRKRTKLLLRTLWKICWRPGEAFLHFLSLVEVARQTGRKVPFAPSETFVKLLLLKFS